MSEELRQGELVELLMQHNAILQGRIEGLTVAVNALALAVTLEEPEYGAVVRKILLDFAEKRENTSEDLEDDLSIGGFRKQIEEANGHLRIE